MNKNLQNTEETTVFKNLSKTHRNPGFKNLAIWLQDQWHREMLYIDTKIEHFIAAGNMQQNQIFSGSVQNRAKINDSERPCKIQPEHPFSKNLLNDPRIEGSKSWKSSLK